MSLSQLLKHLASGFPTMKFHAIELPPSGKNTSQNGSKRLFLTLTLIFFTSIPLYLIRKSQSPLPSQEIDISSLRKNRQVSKKCDIFKGKWVPHPEGPYYTNETCPLIIDQHNCMKFGRPDTEFMRWRWKPDECELPYFDAVQFLELVRGKSMAFLGDSVGKNQMHSLFCLLSSVRNSIIFTNIFSTLLIHKKCKEYDIDYVSFAGGFSRRCFR